MSLLWDEDTGAADILNLAFGFFREKLGFDDEGLCRQVTLSEHLEEALWEVLVNSETVVSMN